MTDWFYPWNTAAEGDTWQVSLGAQGSTTQVDGWAYTGIKVADVAAGGSVGLPAADEERVVVPLAGAVTVLVGDTTYELAGRADVFAGATDSLFVGSGSALTITSPLGGRVAVATSPTTQRKPDVVLPAAQVSVRGTGSCSREIRNICMAGDADAAKLLVCEVITPAGNWSSYPPHKHDEITDTENALEEIYYFQTRPMPGAPAQQDSSLGYVRVYSTDDARPIDVKAEMSDGDTLLVPHGWHGPAAAAPGYDMYYLNVMAGPGLRQWVVTQDPAHAWVVEAMSSQPTDARLPIGDH